MTSYNLAQLNLAHLSAPLDSPVLTDFVANLDRINLLAEQSPGFVWRLQTEEGDATSLRHFGEDVIVNLTVWRDTQSLHDYVYRSAHVEIMRRRKEWFQKMTEAYMVLWWVPEGHLPSLEEAGEKLARLRKYGPTAQAFTFKNAFSAPDSEALKPLAGFDGTCPA